jgi:aconitate decarboxylase
LAAAGYVGIKAVLERPYGGYLPVFGEGHEPDPSRVTQGLGEVWESERIAIKPYAAMGALHAAIEGALQLRPELIGDDGTLDDAQVSAIDIAMGGGAYEHGGWPARRPLTPIGAQMNVAYTTAVALLDGNVLAAQFSSARINADDVWSLIDRTRVRHEPAIDRLPPDLRLTTMVAITGSDGTCREVTVSHPKGVGPRALSEAEVVDKYRSLTAGLLEPDRQSAIEATVLGIEELPHVQRLIDLLTPSVARTLD